MDRLEAHIKVRFALDYKESHDSLEPLIVKVYNAFEAKTCENCEYCT